MKQVKIQSLADVVNQLKAQKNYSMMQLGNSYLIQAKLARKALLKCPVKSLSKNIGEVSSNPINQSIINEEKKQTISFIKLKQLMQPSQSYHQNQNTLKKKKIKMKFQNKFQSDSMQILNRGKNRQSQIPQINVSPNHSNNTKALSFTQDKIYNFSNNLLSKIQEKTKSIFKKKYDNLINNSSDQKLNLAAQEKQRQLEKF